MRTLTLHISEEVLSQLTNLLVAKRITGSLYGVADEFLVLLEEALSKNEKELTLALRKGMTFPYSSRLLKTLQEAAAEAEELHIEDAQQEYLEWIDQLQSEESLSKGLVKYLDNQADYYQPKEPKYAAYLRELTTKGV